MAAELNARSTHAPGFERLTSTRASEGVLRVLNLQLQPAELGLVTIKMRLAGDGLEMELQVASEETAQLLRNDTEKLSSLLRGSGYRPDTISIQVGRTEAAAQDGGFSQRQDTMSQSQQQGFHQGTANQGGRSRQQDDGYTHEGTGVRNDANDEDFSAARSSSGIYL
jgi:flagellar hook-length control protein FliK